MLAVWSKFISSSCPWEPEYFGLFYKQGTDVTFFFKDRSSLRAISEKDSKARTVFTAYGKEPLSLPRRIWSIVEDCGTHYLFISQNTAMDLKSNTFLAPVPSQMRRAYLETVRPEKYYVEASYSLGEYTISHKGSCGYTCTKQGKKLWDFTGRAYLYTDMTRWNNRLFFGTAGHGGYFYILDIDTGTPLAAIKTGGTVSIAQDQNKCYVLCNATSTQLLCIDLSNGEILSRCDLPGKATDNSRVTLIGRSVHAITFQYAGRALTGAIWSCIEI